MNTWLGIFNEISLSLFQYYGFCGHCKNDGLFLEAYRYARVEQTKMCRFLQNIPTSFLAS